MSYNLFWLSCWKLSTIYGVARKTDSMANLGWEAWLSIGVVLVILIALAREMAPTDALLVGGAVILGLTRVITPQEVFAGFSNTGMLTVAGLYVVVAALRETGALNTMGSLLLGKTTTERGVFLKMSAAVTTISAFLNNTPIVAMMLPILMGWCRKNSVSPSKLLMPLSFLTILGGTCTLIGTSTNLVVNGLLIDASKNAAADVELANSLRPMTLFELSYVGIPCAIAGILYLFFIGRRLLPDRKDLIERLGQNAREYLVNMRIAQGCKLIGKRVEEAGLRHLQGLFLIEILRGDEVISPVGPDQVMHEGDMLTFTGVVGHIVDLEQIPGLIPAGDETYQEHASTRRGIQLCEAVISGTSPLIGVNIREANFRSLYNAAVVAVHRGGERLKGKLGDIILRNGDTLLLQAGANFAKAFRNHPDFFLVSSVEGTRPIRHDKMWLSLALLAVFVVLLTTEIVDTAIAAFLVAGLMVASRCISANDARRSVDYQTLITIGASFAIGKALMTSGAVHGIAETLVHSMGSYGPHAVLFVVYAMTLMTTELITNNAAAVLMFPFAVELARTLGVDPRPFAMAVTMAASNAFSLPLGYQTHLMVYGPGGYKFRDFVRVGLPLDIICLIVAVALIPYVWKF